MNKLIGLALIALFTAGASLVSADVSPKVEKTFRGRILITASDLPDSRSTDAETVKALEKAHLKSVKGSKNADGVSEWSINFTAFFKKAPKTSTLSFDFYTADKDKLYVANKGLMGVDPKMTIMSGVLSINEDDGVNRGRTYVIKLTAKVKKREVVLAETTLTLK